MGSVAKPALKKCRQYCMIFTVSISDAIPFSQYCVRTYI
jgi:hypothetical protein